MKNERTFRQCFVKQANVNDCGLACLKMILNYCGRPDGIAKMTVHPSTESGITLLELRNLATDAGLRCRAVSMDNDYLRTINSPVILHMNSLTGEGHYQVCFGGEKKGNSYRYLLADPAKFLYLISEKELTEQWTGHAALYFDDLSLAKSSILPNWIHLFKAGFFPGLIWFVVPVLGAIGGASNLIFSWLLQNGINDPLSDHKFAIVAAVIVLLFTILIFKGVTGYIKQRVQIRLNLIVNENLYGGMISKLFKQQLFLGNPGDVPVAKATSEIQKIQAAVNALISVILSDGIVVIMLTLGNFYWLTLAGFVNLIFICSMLIITARILPELAYDYASLNQLSGGLESRLKFRHQHNGHRVDHSDEDYLSTEKWYQNYASLSHAIALKISRVNLLYEFIQAFSLICVFVFGLIKVNHNDISYSTFILMVFFTFFSGVLSIRICNALYVVSDGTEAFKQFKINFGD